MAVTLTFASGRGHALIGRALYLPEGCAAEEEQCELAGVPDDVMFAAKPQRWTAICLLAYIYLAVAIAVQRQHDADSGLDAGLVPVTVPELLRLLRDIVIPPPWRDRAHRLYWSTWRRRHQHRARQAHQRWNACAERIPLVKGGD